MPEYNECLLPPHERVSSYVLVYFKINSYE